MLVDTSVWIDHLRRSNHDLEYLRRHLGVRVRALRDAHGLAPVQGDDITDTITAVLRDEPDWTALPAVPPAVATVLRRCIYGAAMVKVSIDGGERVQIASLRGIPGPYNLIVGNAAWFPDDRIVFTTGFSGLLEVTSGNATPAEVMPVRASNEDFYGAVALPDGSVLTSVHHDDVIDAFEIVRGAERTCRAQRAAWRHSNRCRDHADATRSRRRCVSSESAGMLRRAVISLSAATS